MQIEGTDIAVIGLGQIGYPVAGRIARAGARVAVHNRSQSKAEAWCEEHGGAVAESAASAVRSASVVVTCVGDDSDLRSLFYGEAGVLEALGPRTLVIDHTTASSAVARELGEQVRNRGGEFLDCPVSGGSKGAQDGTLSIMVGGDRESFERAQSLLETYGGRVSHVGPTGAGQLCKMVNQICIAGVLEGLAEGLAFAKTSGLDAERVLEVISAGAASSWQMQNRSSYMLEGSFPAGFAARLMHKDLSLCLREAIDANIPLPVAAIVEQQYSRLLALGHGNEDFSNLFRLLTTDGAVSQPHGLAR